MSSNKSVSLLYALGSNGCVKLKSLWQFFVVCLTLCVSVKSGDSETQRNEDQPEAISKDAQAIVAVLTIIGFIGLCVVVGVLVYCICQPWRQHRHRPSRELDAQNSSSSIHTL